MQAVTEARGTVLPPVLAFHHAPKTIDDLLLRTCGKVPDQFRIARNVSYHCPEVPGLHTSCLGSTI
jgi:3-polyprenyl-4-hydroxybenzoate decarboxylase